MAKTAVLDAPVCVSVYLEAWMVEELKRLGGGNVSRGARKLIARHLAGDANEAQEQREARRG